MGWGTEVNGLYLNRVLPENFTSELEETEDFIKFLRLKITTAVAYTSPVVDDGEEKKSLLDYAAFDIVGYLDELEEAVFKRDLIKHALANPEEIKRDE